MQIIKPLKLGLIHRALYLDGRHQLCVSPLLWFSLSDGTVVPEQLAWKKMMACLDEGTVLDSGAPKQFPEVLLSGKAYARNPKKAVSMEVGVRLGDSFEKHVQVVGEQSWLFTDQGWTLTQEAPFDEMDLTWRNAFGGNGFAENAVGQGFVSPDEMRNLVVGASVSRPNLRAINETQRRPEDRMTASCFGPVAITAPSRVKRAGTYDDDWLVNHYPGLPPDHDPAVFNTAMTDQWIHGKVQGNESFELWGVSPTSPTIQGALPNVHVRAFVRKHAQTSLEEVSTRIDTVWFFPDQDIGLMVYRGLSDIDDSDALDIASLMLAYESQNDAPRSQAEYQKIYAARTDRQTAIAHMLNESQLSPRKSTEQQAQLDAEKLDAQSQLHAQVAQSKQAILDRVDPDANIAEAVQQTPTKILVPPVPKQAIQRGDVDLTDTLQALTRLAEQAKSDSDSKLKSLDQTPSESQTDQPITTRDLERRFDAIQAAPDVGISSEKQQHLLSLSITGRRLSPTDTTASDQLTQTARQRLRGAVLSAMARGQSLAGLDLSGADLRDLDFTGADLETTQFEGADLTGCLFTGANLKDAVFTGAKLDHAKLNQCQLGGANFSKVTAANCQFKHAKIGATMTLEANFTRCDFSGAKLDGASFINSHFTDCLLNGCLLNNVRFMQSAFIKTSFIGATFFQAMFLDSSLKATLIQQSIITRSIFAQVNAAEVDFQHAVLDRVQFGGACALIGANFSSATANIIGFQGADLTESNFSNAAIKQGNFTDCPLNRADLQSAAFYQCVFSGARFDNTYARQANFAESLMRKSRWRQSELNCAEFFGVNAKESSFDQCNLTNAKNLPSHIEVRI